VHAHIPEVLKIRTNVLRPVVCRRHLSSLQQL
jgi:hypothetical protein